MISRFESIRHNRKLLATLVTALALMVAIGTTYTLISPASTMETPVEEQVAVEGTDSEDAGTAGSVTEEINENGLTADEQASVDRVIGLIDELPTYEQIEEQILAYDEAGDMDAMEAYYSDVILDIKIAQNAYVTLDEKLQPYVTNYEKLQDLEGFSQAEVLLDEITSDIPTVRTENVVSTSSFVNLNMYDYYGAASASNADKTNINALWNSNKKYPGFQWNGGAYMTSSSFSRARVDNIDFGNSMITDFTYGSLGSPVTDGYSANRQMVGGKGGTINKVIGYTNQPIGYSSGSDYDALSHKLKNSYPALSDGTSLNYLFSESDYAKKLNSENIDGLFQLDPQTGEYWYDSRINHAYYNNNSFTLYNQVITPNFILYPFGNFLPLNGITDGDKTTQVSAIECVVQGSNGNSGYMQTIINRLLEGNENAAESQLIDMLAYYRNSLSEDTSKEKNRYEYTVVQALNDYFDNSSEFKNENVDFESQEMQNLFAKLYNIDFDVKKNFMFGMDMSMTFMQPKDGLAGNDTNKDGISDYPMKFYFAGDDDVWVFIDDILFLDLTGIHRHVGGDIDFVNGKVNYYMMKSYVNGQVSSTPYKTMTFAEILTDIGGVAEEDLGDYLKQDENGNYTTFKDYSYHKFNFYYMERGTGSSVCRINFNFPLLKQNTISVAKEVTSDGGTLGDPTFKFQVLKADEEGNKSDELFIAAGTAYTIYDANNNVIGTGTTDANGIIALKDGQRAEFEGIKENSGKYYVRELFDPEFAAQYDQITVSGESTTTSNNVKVGEDTFTGADSPVKDSSNGATVFKFTNDIDTFKLGSMTIGKVLKPNDAPEKEFDFNVTIDDKPIPAGTVYTVDGAERKVGTEGIITLKAGEVALIEKIKAGTVVTVQETSESADGYTTIYRGTGFTTAADENSRTYATGVINVPADENDETAVETFIKVVNTTGTSVQIPITKTIKDPNGDRTFNFVLQECDENGEVPVGASSQNLQINLDSSGKMVNADGSEAAPCFVIDYPASTAVGTYYYKITEVNEGDTNMVYDSTAHIVKVVVSEDEDGALQAAVYKNDMGITGLGFSNTQLYSLSITKDVPDIRDDSEFLFTVNLTKADGTPLTGEFVWTKKGIAQNSPLTFKETVVTIDGQKKTVGQAMISMKDGDTVKIDGLPAGTEWTVTESADKSDGYVTKYKVNSDTELTKGMSAGNTIAAGSSGNQVTFVNEPCYMLPETGGMGTKPFYIGGLLMIAGAFVMMMRQRRREG